MLTAPPPPLFFGAAPLFHPSPSAGESLFVVGGFFGCLFYIFFFFGSYI